jgi:hypothetical protein
MLMSMPRVWIAAIQFHWLTAPSDLAAARVKDEPFEAKAAGTRCAAKPHELLMPLIKCFGRV